MDLKYQPSQILEALKINEGQEQQMNVVKEVGNHSKLEETLAYLSKGKIDLFYIVYLKLTLIRSYHEYHNLSQNV